MYYALVLFKYSSVKHLPVKFRTLQFSSSKFQSNIPDFLLLPEQEIPHCSHSVMNHIKFLLYDCWPLDPLVSQAASLGKYVPQTGHGEAPPFNTLVSELVSCLEEKLITKSQLFLDKGLRFLFLLNNSNFIWD